MKQLKSLGRDRLSAALLIALGSGALALGLGYRTGSLSRMGAGYVPVVLGVLLILVGVAIGVTATATATATDAGSHERVDPLAGHTRHARGLDVRGGVCIIGGVLAFVALGVYGGLVPASFGSVFVAALGDRGNSWRGAAALSAILTLFGVVVFHVGLRLQLPLFQWGG